jgi:hypothetical protein
MNKIKILLSVFVLIAITFIYTQNNLWAQNKGDESSQPIVFVKDIVLNQQTYSPGDILSGTFTLDNKSNRDVLGITFSKRFASDYEFGLPKNFYDTELDDQIINIRSNEIKTIDFQIQIPKNLGGEAGIQINAYHKGLPLSWSDSMFVLDQENRFLKVSNAYISLGEENFEIQTGPTFKEGDSPVLNVLIQNIDNLDKAITPKLTINRYQSKQDIIFSDLLNPFNIISDQSEFLYNTELPIIKDKPGVYEGLIDFYDEDQNKIITSITFRYIVDGDYVTIHDVSISPRAVSKNDTVSVLLNYSGKPHQFNLEEIEILENVELLVELFDQKGNLLGSHNENLDYIDTDIEKVISIQVNKKADYVIVKISFIKDDQVIGLYEEVDPAFPKEDISFNYLKWFYIAIIIFIVFIIIFTLIKKNNNPIITRTLPVLLIVLFIASSFGYFINNSYSQQNSIASFSYSIREGSNICSNNDSSQTSCISGPAICNRMRSDRGETGAHNCHNVKPYVIVNHPNSSDIIPGKTINITGSMAYSACNNSFGEQVLYQKNPNGTLTTLSYRGGNFGGRTWVSESAPFTISNFVVPVAPGRHVFSYRGVTCTYGAGHTRCGWQDFDVIINIPAPAQPPLTCSSTPEIAHVGQPVTWTTNNTTGPYSWTGSENLSGNTRTVTKTYAETGTRTATITVGSETATCTKNILPMEAVCSVSPNPLVVGQTATWSGSVLGGTGPHTYSWSGTDLSASTQNVSKVYNTIGPKSATLTVRDSLGRSNTKQCPVLTVCPIDNPNCNNDGNTNPPGGGGTDNPPTGGGTTNPPGSGTTTPPQLTDLNVTATPRIIEKGDNCVIEVTAENANQCTISGGDLGEPQPLNDGKYTIFSLQNTTIYTVQCSNEAGQPDEYSVTCQINPDPKQF